MITDSERVTLSWTEGTGLGTLEFDATLTEQHSAQAEVTQFPVETGASISDHVVVRPARLRLEGLVSNTPIQDVFPGQAPDAEDRRGSVAKGRTSEWSGRAGAAYTQLVVLHELGTPVRVSTQLRDYDSMVIQTLEVPRDAETGDVLRFMMELQQVNTVATRTIDLEKSDKPAKRSLGRQPTKKAPESTPKPPKSVFKAGVQMITH